MGLQVPRTFLHFLPEVRRRKMKRKKRPKPKSVFPSGSFRPPTPPPTRDHTRSHMCTHTVGHQVRVSPSCAWDTSDSFRNPVLDPVPSPTDVFPLGSLGSDTRSRLPISSLYPVVEEPEQGLPTCPGLRLDLSFPVTLPFLQCPVEDWGPLTGPRTSTYEGKLGGGMRPSVHSWWCKT